MVLVVDLPTGLPVPRTHEGVEALSALLADPAHALIALDFDGTLAPIVSRPDQAFAHPDVPDALATLAPRVGNVAIVTGRPAADAVRLGRLAGVAPLTIMGHYGLERWQDGRLESPPEHPGVERLREPLAALVRSAPAGTALEDKGHSLAVHTRGTAQPQAALDGLQVKVDTLAVEAGLEVVPGRLVLECRPPGTDKGGALRTLVAQTGARSVLFAGDDIGDLPAVAAVHDLRERGVAGLVVCADSAESPAGLRDQADLIVDGPEGVVALLKTLAANLGSVDRGPE